MSLPAMHEKGPTEGTMRSRFAGHCSDFGIAPERLMVRPSFFFQFVRVDDLLALVLRTPVQEASLFEFV